ncbi:MAG: hypothetical protein ABJP48_04180 [Erythrobacter sp.]
MNLEEIYYIGQTIAVVAILGSLLAIWFQMRQSQKMERASAQREILQRTAEFARSFQREEVDPFVLGLHEWDGAAYEARFVTDGKIAEFLFLAEAAFYLHKDGFFNTGTLAGIEGYLISMLRARGGQQYWAFKQHRIGPDYVAYLNARIEATSEDTPTFFEAEPHFRSRLEELLAAQGKPALTDRHQGNEDIAQ